MTTEPRSEEVSKAVQDALLNLVPTRRRLTKRFYEQLVPGTCLVGNSLDPRTLHPIFSECVSADREGQWARIQKAGADQRICSVFANAEAAERYLAFEMAAFMRNQEGASCFQTPSSTSKSPVMAATTTGQER